MSPTSALQTRIKGAFGRPQASVSDRRRLCRKGQEQSAGIRVRPTQLGPRTPRCLAARASALIPAPGSWARPWGC